MHILYIHTCAHLYMHTYSWLLFNPSAVSRSLPLGALCRNTADSAVFRPMGRNTADSAVFRRTGARGRVWQDLGLQRLNFKTTTTTTTPTTTTPTSRSRAKPFFCRRLPALCVGSRCEGSKPRAPTVLRWQSLRGLEATGRDSTDGTLTPSHTHISPSPIYMYIYIYIYICSHAYTYVYISMYIYIRV